MGQLLRLTLEGDTLQLLHVSELGKIAKKYPEKARVEDWCFSVCINT